MVNSDASLRDSVLSSTSRDQRDLGSNRNASALCTSIVIKPLAAFLALVTISILLRIEISLLEPLGAFHWVLIMRHYAMYNKPCNKHNKANYLATICKLHEIYEDMYFCTLHLPSKWNLQNYYKHLNNSYKENYQTAWQTSKQIKLDATCLKKSWTVTCIVGCWDMFSG